MASMLGGLFVCCRVVLWHKYGNNMGLVFILVSGLVGATLVVLGVSRRHAVELNDGGFEFG